VADRTETGLVDGAGKVIARGQPALQAVDPGRAPIFHRTDADGRDEATTKTRRAHARTRCQFAQMQFLIGVPFDIASQLAHAL